MRMDVIGINPAAEAGEYFRNNVWYWRPLWNYVIDVARDIVNDDVANGCHYNGGSGLNAEQAVALADRLVVMSEGSVRQIGSQRELYEQPADRFVAGFVGRTTFLEGAVEAPGRFRTGGGLSLACAGGAPGKAALSLRPERLEIGAARQTGLDNSLPGTVEFVSYLGALIDIHVRLSPADRVVVQVANRDGGFAASVGQPVFVGWQASAGQVFGE